MSDNRASISIVAGPNGAGKTTFVENFLIRYVDCDEFLNADLIAAGLSPFAPERQNLKASVLFLVLVCHGTTVTKHGIEQTPKRKIAFAGLTKR